MQPCLQHKMLHRDARNLGSLLYILSCELLVGIRQKTPGPGAQSALRALARSGMKIGHIEDVTPIPTDSSRRKGRKKEGGDCSSSTVLVPFRYLLKL
ncbi:hypothetical protein OPV22_019594 [Ensete ventricosum]|uniref:Uncharacterized protein n=1 Tax=Ensete ventricosum TaxID=4639 RepID=A0AAV8QLD2_ENSVE|nr:hypothetical protein OPV22_019594 [Ensete ventricosum]